MSLSVESKIGQVFNLLQNGCRQGYTGENTSQLEHAFQAAHQAVQDKTDQETILAALLHDIGHLCPAKERKQMLVASNNNGSVGVMEHERVGAEYLKHLGFSQKLCELVESHVIAKRYLTAVDPEYLEGLSDASKMSLRFQGGPFSIEQVKALESDPLFSEKVKLRRWDDAAKLVGLETPSLGFYREMAIDHLGTQANC